jgi:hypothetical protein
MSCPIFSNLKTLAIGDWCISTGADFDILVLYFCQKAMYTQSWTVMFIRRIKNYKLQEVKTGENIFNRQCRRNKQCLTIESTKPIRLKDTTIQIQDLYSAIILHANGFLEQFS